MPLVPSAIPILAPHGPLGREADAMAGASPSPNRSDVCGAGPRTTDCARGFRLAQPPPWNTPRRRAVMESHVGMGSQGFASTPAGARRGRPRLWRTPSRWARISSSAPTATIPGRAKASVCSLTNSRTRCSSPKAWDQASSAIPFPGRPPSPRPRPPTPEADPKKRPPICHRFHTPHPVSVHLPDCHAPDATTGNPPGSRPHRPLVPLL